MSGSQAAGRVPSINDRLIQAIIRAFGCAMGQSSDPTTRLSEPASSSDSNTDSCPPATRPRSSRSPRNRVRQSAPRRLLSSSVSLFPITTIELTGLRITLIHARRQSRSPIRPVRKLKQNMSRAANSIAPSHFAHNPQAPPDSPSATPPSGRRPASSETESAPPRDKVAGHSLAVL